MKTKYYMSCLEDFIKEYDLHEADIVASPADKGGIDYTFTIDIADTKNEQLIYDLFLDIDGQRAAMGITHRLNTGEIVPMLPNEANMIREANFVANSKETTWVNITERDINIMRDIDAGMKFTEAGKKYGISTARAAECYSRAKRRSKYADLVNDATVIGFREYALLNLSTRTFNAITRGGILDYDTFLSKTDEELLHIRGLGPLAIAQLHIFKEKILRDRAK